MSCPKCGYNPDAPVAARWEFEIPKELVSLNRSAKNTGSRWAHARYRKEREEWMSWLRVARCEQPLTVATGKRRVTITRVIGYRQREFDRDNLVGGGKVIVDAMVREGLLLGDDSARAEVHYEQVRHGGGMCGSVRIVIEELA